MFVKKISWIFSLAFILNLLWEKLHSFLYASYRGGKITEWILIHASVWDAIIITLLILVVKKPQWVVVAGILIAITIELYALSTGRWAYNSFMPIIPLINVGLTPVLQLGLLGCLTLGLTRKFC